MNTRDAFDLQRVINLLCIEFSNYWKRVLMATGMLFAIGIIIYANVSEGQGSFSEGFFFILILLGVAMFASIIFNDMHHPLEQYQYMMLPCSQLERFTSKYFLTGPIFLLYTIVIATLFKTLAPLIVTLLGDTPAVFIPIEAVDFELLLIVYFTVHILFLTGAIVFRSFAVVKTGLTLFLLPYTFFFATLVSLKIFYFDHFSGFWDIDMNREVLPGALVPLIRYDLFLGTTWVLIYLWLVFMAYTCLKDHEA